MSSCYGSVAWEFESFSGCTYLSRSQTKLHECNLKGYTFNVICSFRHKGLKQLFEKGDRSKVPQQNAERIIRLMDALDAAKIVQDLNLPGFGLHELKGNRKGTWAVSVTGNLRITFSFQNGEARGVNLEDYH